jgi:pyruvate dehydrogenase E2 component (dihydrolipoyllysine-residue acetyltransferase)
MIEFLMPMLGADMEAGTLIEWLKHPGDAVKRGDIIAVVDTDKGAIEIEVFNDGILDRLMVEAGQKVPVGTVLAHIRESGEAPATGAPVTPAPPALAPPIGERSEAHHRASPAARRAAEQLHVDLGSVTGTGPRGAVTLSDVERATSRGRVSPPVPAEAAAPVDRTAAMRRAIAAAMARSKREIPHLYLAATIDMSCALDWLSKENERRSVERRLLLIALLMKAVAKAVGEVPGVNGFWRQDAFQPATGVHVGCAVALRGGGLVAPAVHDTDRKDLDTLMRDVLDVVARARAGTLRSSELADSTITVTSMGELGAEAAFGIIYPPQVAIVAFGRPAQRPWVVEGRVEPRPVMTASVSADHRAVDGRRAGQFLAAVDRWLQTPEKL